MNKKITEFIKVSRDKRIEDLMGVSTDIAYFNDFLARNNEDQLRDDLAEEEKKKFTQDLESKNRNIKFKDGRDQQKIHELNVKINTVDEVKKKKMQYMETYENVLRYINLLDNPTPELLEQLELLAKL